jgi:hypothetical protein
VGFHLESASINDIYLVQQSRLEDGQIMGTRIRRHAREGDVSICSGGRKVIVERFP